MCIEKRFGLPAEATKLRMSGAAVALEIHTRAVVGEALDNMIAVGNAAGFLATKCGRLELGASPAHDWAASGVGS